MNLTAVLVYGEDVDDDGLEERKAKADVIRRLDKLEKRRIDSMTFEEKKEYD